MIDDIVSERMQSDHPDTRSSLEFIPSETAMGAAVIRYLANMEDPLSGPDFLAGIFIHGGRRSELKDPEKRKAALRAMIPGMFEFINARTNFFDSIVTAALERNIPQIVILGAGYDSRACRFQNILKDTRIFEVDIRTTQGRKLRKLGLAGIFIPGQLHFVPVNFETDDLGESLRKAGFRSDKQSLFVWEGVTYYLPLSAVDATFRAVKTFAPAGSRICFDYAALSSEIIDDVKVAKLREHMKLRHANEPARFGIKEGDTGRFLSERGFRIIEHYSSEEMELKFLKTPSGPIPKLFCLALAEIV